MIDTTGNLDDEESTFVLTGAAVIPTDQIVLPTETMVKYSGGPPLWNEESILAQRPSEDHYIVWAAVWVPQRVLEAS